MHCKTPYNFSTVTGFQAATGKHVFHLKQAKAFWSNVELLIATAPFDFGPAVYNPRFWIQIQNLKVKLTNAHHFSRQKLVTGRICSRGLPRGSIGSWPSILCREPLLLDRTPKCFIEHCRANIVMISSTAEIMTVVCGMR